MLCTLRLVLSLTVCLTLCSAAQANFIYSFVSYPLLQAGHTLSGTIETTMTAPDDGLLVTSEIVDWSVTVSGPNGFSIGRTGSSPPEVTGTVAISPTQITIGSPPTDPATNALEFQESLGGLVPQLRYLYLVDFFGPGVIEEYSAGVNGSAWQSFAIPSQFVVATRNATPIPEASSLGIWAALLAISGFFWRGRSLGGPIG